MERLARSNDDPPFFEQIRGFLRHIGQFFSPPLSPQSISNGCTQNFWNNEKEEKKGEKKRKGSESRHEDSQKIRKKSFFLYFSEIIGLRTETVSSHDNKGNTIAKSRVLNLQTGHMSRV